jgi:hypothetical protein
VTGPFASEQAPCLTRGSRIAARPPLSPTWGCQHRLTAVAPDAAWASKFNGRSTIAGHGRTGAVASHHGGRRSTVVSRQGPIN